MNIRRFVQLVFVASAGLAGAALVVAGLANANHRSLVESQLARTESLRLAGELRQSSNDLTRFVRTYVATGDPKYERFYWDVLAIRNGEKPRPPHYDRIYWDFVADGRPEATDGRRVSLRQLMQESGFSQEELAKLSESQAESDALVKTETAAMHAMKGEFADGSGGFTRRAKPDPAFAVRAVNDSAYHHYKARIMEGIDAFLTMVDVRTAASVDAYTQRSALYWRLLLAIMAMLVGVLALAYSLGRRRVFEPVAALQRQTAMVAADLDRLAAVARQNAEGQRQQLFTAASMPLGSARADEVGDLSRMQDAMIAQLQEAGASVAKLTGDLRVAKDAAERASRAKSAFLATISHEIRTPMNAILGYGQLLQAGNGLSPEQRRKLDVIRTSGEHLLSLINDILDMSRIEAERVALSVEPFDVRAVLDDVASMFMAQARARGLALDVHVDPDVPNAIESDPGKVRQIVTNLVGNALKFTDVGGVRVRARSEAAGKAARIVSIEVEDTGPGVAAVDIESIFEAFGQSEVGAQKGGTGLGLAISRSFARLMSGDVTVRSAPGRGSIFTFTFAAVPVPGELLDLHRGRIGPERLLLDEMRRKVLIVDDVATNRELLVETLSRVGFETRSVNSGEDAVAVHDEWRPDLVITDLHMPGIGGLEAIRILRRRGATTPILVATASVDADTSAAVREAGVQRLLRKPYPHRDLLRAIVDTLGVTFEAVPRTSGGNAAAAPSTPAAALPKFADEIPAPLADALRDAARQARAARLHELAGEAESHSARVAALIREYADNFQYAAILKALDGDSANGD
ncbi:MAG: ATP-binding protein [Gemmatimonadales bacterium]